MATGLEAGIARRRRSVTDTMDSDAEKLWSASTRGLLKFEDILPIPGIMPNGGIGVGPGRKGKMALWAYIKHPAVLARLENEKLCALSCRSTSLLAPGEGQWQCLPGRQSPLPLAH